jgi:NAD(P) transhydrogenase subunit alpha
MRARIFLILLALAVLAAPIWATEPAAADAAAGAMSSKALGPLLIGIYVFVLTIFVGFEIITKIPPTLHTPLMSGANAVSGVTVVGALYAAQKGSLEISSLLGCLAIILATINVVGGFLVTDRMLGMFAGKKKKRAAS